MVKKLFFCAVACTLIYCSIEARGRGDLSIFLLASRNLFQGKDIYTITYFDGYHYYYSVLFACLIYPFNFLPTYINHLLWELLNACFLYFIIRIICRYLNSDLLGNKQKGVLFIICFIFSLEFVWANFHYLQITICILFLALYGIDAVFNGNKLLGSILIALSINFKLLPIVLLPYLLYRREFLASFYVVISLLFMLFIPSLLIGFHQNNVLLASYRTLLKAGNYNSIIDEDIGFFDLPALLFSLLTDKFPSNSPLHFKRNITSFNLTQFYYILNGFRLVLILFSLYFFRSKPFTIQENKIHRYWEISYLFLLVPLIFPHQKDYAFLFIVPAMSYIFYYLFIYYKSIKNSKFYFLLSGCILSYLFCNSILILGEFNAYYYYFHIITYGALLIIPMLAVCTHPKQFSSVKS